MRSRCLILFGALAALVAVGSVPMAAQAPTKPTKPWTQPRTAWGDPDLQGIWRGLTAVPIERPAEFEGREFLTDAEVAVKVKKMQEVAALRLAGKKEFRGFRATPGYNQIFSYEKDSANPRVSRRTSAIIDPPNGHLPPWTLEQVRRYEEREAATRGHG